MVTREAVRASESVVTTLGPKGRWNVAAPGPHAAARAANDRGGRTVRKSRAPVTVLT